MVVGGVWYVSLKDKFILRISTASGEVDATASKDREYIKEVVAALNQAIVERG